MIVLLALLDRLELCFGLNNTALKNTIWLHSDYVTGLNSTVRST